MSKTNFMLDKKALIISQDYLSILGLFTFLKQRRLKLFRLNSSSPFCQAQQYYFPSTLIELTMSLFTLSTIAK